MKDTLNQVYILKKLLENKNNVLPISFAIPKEKILKTVNEKPTNLLHH